MKKEKWSYDFSLILLTAVVLFIISLLCVYGMFYFKIAQVHQMEAVAKTTYMHRMNQAVAPFVMALIVLLGICVPKRLLPTAWLHRFAATLVALTSLVSFLQGIRQGLLCILVASLILQTIVLGLALMGRQSLLFEKKGYWVRLGSSLIHLGLILFVLDLFFYDLQTLHLLLFWITTGTTLLGMLFCFYSSAVVRLVRPAPLFPDNAP